MGKAEIMLKVLSSPEVDAASITAMLGDNSDDPVVQQLLALRAGDPDKRDHGERFFPLNLSISLRFAAKTSPIDLSGVVPLPLDVG